MFFKKLYSDRGNTERESQQRKYHDWESYIYSGICIWFVSWWPYILPHSSQLLVCLLLVALQLTGVQPTFSQATMIYRKSCASCRRCTSLPDESLLACGLLVYLNVAVTRASLTKPPDPQRMRHWAVTIVTSTFTY